MSPNGPPQCTAQARSSMWSGRCVGAPAWWARGVPSARHQATDSAPDPAPRSEPAPRSDPDPAPTLRSRQTTWTWAAWSRWRRCWPTSPAACSPSATTARSWPAPPRACSCCAATASCASLRAPTTRCGGRAGYWLRPRCAARRPVPGTSGSKGARVQQGVFLNVRAPHAAPGTGAAPGSRGGAGAAAAVCRLTGCRRRRRAQAPALLAACAAV
jgi:hypothetical protein